MDSTQWQKLHSHYEKLLNPEKLKSNLIVASLYLTAYEMMRTSIMDHVRGLFCCVGEVIGKEQYNRDVLQLHPKDAFRASCLWVQQSGGLAADDLTEIQRLRKKRNQVAHELPRVISDANVSVDVSWIYRVHEIITKFDRWWLRHFEIDEIDSDTIPDEQIHSGNMILMDLILRTVDGREDELNAIYQGWLEATADAGSSAERPLGPAGCVSTSADEEMMDEQ